MIKTFLNILASVLLLFNGVGALFGGWSLIIHPDGTGLQLSIKWLQHTPFPDYLVPGIILFVGNGLFSVFVFLSTILTLRGYSWLILIQGAILTGWIVIQIALIRTIDFLHILFGSIGIVLFIVGRMLLQYNRRSAITKH